MAVQIADGYLRRQSDDRGTDADPAGYDVRALGRFGSCQSSAGGAIYRGIHELSWPAQRGCFMHIVEVRYCSVDLGAVMAQMRTWVDHQKVEPSLFEMAFLPGRVIRFRLMFQNASDASAFARAFDGEVLSERGAAAA